MKYAAQKALDAFKKIRACTVNVWDVDDEIESLEKAIAEAEKQEPMAFLANGVRFKLNFDSKGRVSSLWNYLSELDGRWVALVAAEDDCHLKLTAPQQRKPLTNEQTDEIIDSPADVRALITDGRGKLRLFARAIEAAHGIKE